MAIFLFLVAPWLLIFRGTRAFPGLPFPGTPDRVAEEHGRLHVLSDGHRKYSTGPGQVFSIALECLAPVQQEGREVCRAVRVLKQRIPCSRKNG